MKTLVGSLGWGALLGCGDDDTAPTATGAGAAGVAGGVGTTAAEGAGAPVAGSGGLGRQAGASGGGQGGMAVLPALELKGAGFPGDFCRATTINDVEVELYLPDPDQ